MQENLLMLSFRINFLSLWCLGVGEDCAFFFFFFFGVIMEKESVRKWGKKETEVNLDR